MTYRLGCASVESPGGHRDGRGTRPGPPTRATSIDRRRTRPGRPSSVVCRRPASRRGVAQLRSLSSRTSNGADDRSDSTDLVADARPAPRSSCTQSRTAATNGPARPRHCRTMTHRATTSTQHEPSGTSSSSNTPDLGGIRLDGRRGAHRSCVRERVPAGGCAVVPTEREDDQDFRPAPVRPSQGSIWRRDPSGSGSGEFQLKRGTRCSYASSAQWLPSVSRQSDKTPASRGPLTLWRRRRYEHSCVTNVVRGGASWRPTRQMG